MWLRNVPDDDFVSRMKNFPWSSTQISAWPRETTFDLNAIRAGSCGVPRAAFVFDELEPPWWLWRSVKRPTRMMAKGARSRSIGSKWSERDDSRCGTRRIFCTCVESVADKSGAVPARERVDEPAFGGFGSEVVAARGEKAGGCCCCCCEADVLASALPNPVLDSPLLVPTAASPPAGGTIPTAGTGGCDELRLCLDLAPSFALLLDVRFESVRRSAGKPYPLEGRSPPGEGGNSVAGDALGLPRVLGLRCADEVVQPRGRRWMNPSERPKRLDEEDEGDPGGRAPVPPPGEGRGTLDEAGERV